MKRVEDSIRAFIVENFLFGDVSRAPLDDDSLLERDIIDSTGILELVSFVEDQFAIAVSDDAIIPANFDSIGKVARFIAASEARAMSRAQVG